MKFNSYILDFEHEEIKTNKEIIMFILRCEDDGEKLNISFDCLNDEAIIYYSFIKKDIYGYVLKNKTFSNGLGDYTLDDWYIEEFKKENLSLQNLLTLIDINNSHDRN